MAVDFEDALKPGTSLQGGKYKIIKAIGQGGFGITYMAKGKEQVQGPIGKMTVEIDVAIKEFFMKDDCERAENSQAVTVPSKKKAGQIEEYRKKFFKEAKNISQLNHDNIVKVINVFEENDTAYFVMEYIAGESLYDIVDKRGAMNEREAVRIIEQLSNALQYVHGRNMTHLDVKPSNILIDTTGTLKLIDFGLAKHYDKDGKATSTGATQGVSEGFSPVEQYSPGGVGVFSPQSDIYSVGATMAFLLTGKVPHKATEPRKHPLPQGVSERVKKAIYAAMQYEKSARPASIADFLMIVGGRVSNDVYNFDFNAGKRQQSGGGNGGTRVIDMNKKDWLKYIWIGLGCVAAVFVIVWWLNKPSTPKPEPTPEPTIVMIENESFNFQGEQFTYTGSAMETDSISIPHGYGEGKYAYGTYSGEYKNGIRDGKGTYVTSDGTNKFEGTFANGNYKTGRLTMDDGSYFEGDFKDNTWYNGGWYLKDGTLDGKVVNGVEQ